MTKRIWTKPLPIAGMVAALALGGSGAALASNGLSQKAAPATSAASTAATGNIVTATVTNAAGAQTFATVACPVNTRVSGGGVFGSGGTQQSVNSSYPSGNGAGWNAYMNNTSTSALSMTVYAICSLAS